MKEKVFVYNKLKTETKAFASVTEKREVQSSFTSKMEMIV